MAQTKTFHSIMSLNHILCSPPAYPEKALNLPYYGLPSPTCSYNSDDDTLQSPIDYTKLQVLSSACLNRKGSTCQTYTKLRRSRKPTIANSDRTHTRIPWSPDEDMLLKQGYEQGLSWAMIASTYLPHRSRGCCWGRLKTLKNKKFLTVQRQLRVKSKPWKTLNPLDMQQQSLSKS